MKYILVSLLLLTSLLLYAQTDTMSQSKTLPYHEIPDYPENYSAGNVVARVIDGLGYRYYWATEGLREEDYKYKPSDDSRTTGETMEHIFALAKTISKVAKNEALVRGEKVLNSPEELRMMTLEYLQEASNVFNGKSSEELSALAVIFKREDRTSEFPFWNLLNGQLSDAIYHTGQITAYRRASGNPASSKMNVFTGKNRD